MVDSRKSTRQQSEWSPTRSSSGCQAAASQPYAARHQVNRAPRMPQPIGVVPSSSAPNSADWLESLFRRRCYCDRAGLDYKPLAVLSKSRGDRFTESNGANVKFSQRRSVFDHGSLANTVDQLPAHPDVEGRDQPQPKARQPRGRTSPAAVPRARIISKERLPEPITIDARNSMT